LPADGKLWLTAIAQVASDYRAVWRLVANVQEVVRMPG
jgi:hypothetical protein